MHSYLQVITTVESKAQAEQLAMMVAAARLAACAQIAGPIRSTYWWKDKLESAEEWQITFKTIESAYPELEALLRQNHPYEVPEIVALPVVNGNPAYLEWIAAEVKSPAGS